MGSVDQNNSTVFPLLADGVFEGIYSSTTNFSEILISVETDTTFELLINFSTNKKLKNCKALVLNALRKEPHISHFTLNEAIQLAQEVHAPATYFTHISHQLGCHTEVSEALPESIFLAYDGLELNLPIN